MYEELIDKYGASAMLLNGLAVSKMQQGQFEEAETNLQEALTKVGRTTVLVCLFTQSRDFLFLDVRFDLFLSILGGLGSRHPRKPGVCGPAPAAPPRSHRQTP